jgi:hypothetical protein
VVRFLAGIVGLLLIVATSWSVLRTLVVPRGSSQLNYTKNQALFACFRFVAHRTGTYLGRDRVLTWASPMAIFTSLLMWLLLFFIAYSLLIFATSDLTLAVSAREAGSSLFTLGYATSDRANLTALDFLAASTGPITIGLLIGYLPTFYAAYQQREADVTLMLARAGEPNWGPELLARHSQVGTLGRLDELWPVWERWAAEISESHTNFPVLIQMRSARPYRNWMISLLCVMDAAAMQVSLNPSMPQDRARLLIRQGVLCLRELAIVQGIPFDDDPSPDSESDVTASDFTEACTMLQGFGYPMERTVADAYLHFRGWRANYESVAYALAQLIDAVPAPWSGPRKPPLPVVTPAMPLNRKPSGSGD